MKKIFGGCILIVFLCVLSSFTVHKYYVSVFQLQYAPDKKRVEVTARIFADDFEKALAARFNTPVYLGTTKENKDTTAFINTYIQEKVHIKINGAPQKLHYITRELDDDTQVLYFTVAAPQQVNTVEVNNTLLFEIYNEQQNMVHTKVGNARKSLLLTAAKPSGKVEF